MYLACGDKQIGVDPVVLASLPRFKLCVRLAFYFHIESRGGERRRQQRLVNRIKSFNLHRLCYTTPSYSTSSRLFLHLCLQRT